MSRRGWVIVAILVASCVGLRPGEAEAAKATIFDTGYKVKGDLVLIRFGVEGAFTKEMVDAIQSGLPTTFTFQIRLFRDLPQLPDERIYTSQIQRTVRYDTLHQQYDVSTGDDHWIVKSLPEAQRLMTRLDDVAVALKASLDPKEKYYAMVKAELAEVKLPFVFSFLRSFAQIWDFETPWTRIDVAREEPAK